MSNGARTTEKTLHLTRPFGQTLGLAIGLLLLLGLLAEMLARSAYFQSLLTEPRMGTRHSQLGPKLARLEAALDEAGSLDCVVIGSSMVDNGFDSLAFSEGFKDSSGKDIRCLNFGIDSSTAASAAALAQILIEDYRPRLLIYGTDPRDYAVPGDETGPAVILGANWIRYRRGQFSLDGWLIEHSFLYRYRQHFYRLSRFDNDSALRSKSTSTAGMTAEGMTPLSTVITFANDPPDPQDNSYLVSYYRRIFASYKMTGENLAGLEEILDHNKQGTQVIVVEMPVPKGLYYFFGNGEDDYRRFVDQIGQLTEAHHAPFWQTTSLAMIPDDGWADYNHLNIKGAAIFSEWLGEKVGKLSDE